MASRKGFEPLTPGLGNLCSILLSYRDVQLRSSRLFGTRPHRFSLMLMIRVAFSNQDPELEKLRALLSLPGTFNHDLQSLSGP